ncbi:PD-(D/E)XK nuclease family protein [Cysteiniphilum litorale]|uniref:PD-(D/E)XK nuclease family protein n=1 Tax=Cysteiniphilum litorale TaxID=2056700 RepID=UPI003F883B63
MNRMNLNSTKIIEKKIRTLLAHNYTHLQKEGGHSLSPYMLAQAYKQVLFYYKKMYQFMAQITEVEVKLTLPGQVTPEGRKFTIEGVVDIVKEHGETWIYDLKTHDKEYIVANPEQYRGQINVYAHIWQGLRHNELDHAGIISTALPRELNLAIKKQNLTEESLHYADNNDKVQQALANWQPIVSIEFNKDLLKQTINAFAEVVDKIENKEFSAPDPSVLNQEIQPKKKFATAVCRNCDLRFSCDAYMAYMTDGTRNKEHFFEKYFKDVAIDEEEQESLFEAEIGKESVLGGVNSNE